MRVRQFGVVCYAHLHSHLKVCMRSPATADLDRSTEYYNILVTDR